MKAMKSERGQVLVFIVLAIFAMMGFAALAVDGGRIYSERRRSQNATDAAAYAAAFAYASDPTVSDAVLTKIVLDKIKENGFTPSADVIVTYNHPPEATNPYSSVANKMEYHQVIISVKTESSFAQIIGVTEQVSEVQSIARGMPSKAIFPGDAMVATDKDSCIGIKFNGNMGTSVSGGNIFSNSKNPGSNCYSGVMKGSSGGVGVTGGEIIGVGGWNYPEGTMSPAPKSGVPSKDLPKMPVPDCTNISTGTINNSTDTLGPGLFSAGIKINGGNWKMNPGLYCIKGDFSVNGNATLTGNEVTIVMLSGSVDFLGGGVIRLSRPKSLIDGSGNNWGGMLFYMPFDNDGGIDMGGNSGSYYSGTVFAPGPRHSSSEKCQVSGNGESIGINANIICHTINIGGTADVSITYKEEQNYRRPPMVELIH